MEKDGLGPEHKVECGHEGCTCLVGPSQSFCSEYCARETTSTGSYNLPGGRHAGGPCKCGHPECGHEGGAATPQS